MICQPFITPQHANQDNLDRDDLPSHYETQKDQQLKSQKTGTAKWNSDLASNSEADVRTYSLFLTD
jgi:hypothetical protein